MLKDSFALDRAGNLDYLTLREQYLLNIRDIGEEDEEGFYDQVISTIARGGSGGTSSDWETKEVISLIEKLSSRMNIDSAKRMLVFMEKLAAPFLNSKEPQHYPKEASLGAFLGIIQMGERVFYLPSPGMILDEQWRDRYFEIIFLIAKELLSCYNYQNRSKSTCNLSHSPTREGEETIKRVFDRWIFGRRDNETGQGEFQEDLVQTFVLSLEKHALEEGVRLKLSNTPSYDEPVSSMIMRCCHHAIGSEYDLWPRVNSIFGREEGPK